jgi:diacylglycerol kinase family enzyme
VASAILVGLTDSFGGGLKLIPDASLRSGTFFALAVAATSRASLLGTLVRLRASRSAGFQARIFTELTSFSVRANGLVGAFADGEWLGLRHRSQVNIEPTALRVLVSPTSAVAPGHSPWLREAI